MPLMTKTSIQTTRDAGSTVIALPCPARPNDIPPVGLEAHDVVYGSEGPRVPTEGRWRA